MHDERAPAEARRIAMPFETAQEYLAFRHALEVGGRFIGTPTPRCEQVHARASVQPAIRFSALDHSDGCSAAA